MKKMATLISVSLIIGGCASPAANVTAIPQPSTAYRNLKCDELQDELHSVSIELKSAAQMQDSKAASDGITLAAGLFLWPMLVVGAVAGGNNSTTTALSTLKGQEEAIKSTMKKNGCAIPEKTQSTASTETKTFSEQNKEDRFRAANGGTMNNLTDINGVK